MENFVVVDPINSYTPFSGGEGMVIYILNLFVHVKMVLLYNIVRTAETHLSTSALGWCNYGESISNICNNLVPGAQKIGGSAWYTLFAHAQSLLGNLHTIRYTNHALTKQSVSG